MLNIITGNLPETVLVSGRKFTIRSDFRVGLQFERIRRNARLSEDEKILKILCLYYPVIPPDLLEAMDRIIWFYQCGDVRNQEDEKKQRYQRKTYSGPAYDFVQDAPYIYADFKNQYGIDLADQTEPMHWWKFAALFESLGEETKMGKVMYYRKVRTTDMPKAQRAFINDMKRLYQIRDVEEHRVSLEERNQRWKDYVKSRVNGVAHR